MLQKKEIPPRQAKKYLLNADLWSGLRGSLDGWRKNGTLARSEAWRKAMGMATSLPVIHPATGALIRQHAMINPAERRHQGERIRARTRSPWDS